MMRSNRENCNTGFVRGREISSKLINSMAVSYFISPDTF